jgi:hypothetical protein
MLELVKHILGFCGDHWHPNIWTAFASSPAVLATVHFIRCKCGGIFKHKNDCDSIWK